MKRSFVREILESIDDTTISFAGGLPDESLFPVDALAQTAHKVFSDPAKWQYALSNGITPLRDYIAARYTNAGFATTREEILITTGSQQAMYLIAKAHFSQPVTIERPSYLGAMNVFRLNHITMDGVVLEPDGIACAPFEESIAKTKLAYLIPDFQNPSTTTYSQEKRNCVADMLIKYDAVLIEDAPYSELYFDHPMPPISMQIPEQSYHLGSFSKSLAPSLRLGWIRTSKERIASLLPIKESIDLHSSTLAVCRLRISQCPGRSV